MPDAEDHRGKRSRGTGKPDPDKDRSAHDRARGQKVGGQSLSLRDLSRPQNLEPHIQDIFDELDNQTDRGAALIATSLVDASLTNALCSRMANFSYFHEVMFLSEGAPLATLSAKIKVARAIGVIGDRPMAHLDAIRRIRNQFAHSILKIDFTHPAIAAEIEKLLPDNNPSWKAHFSTQRRRYIGTVIALSEALQRRAEEHLNTSIEIWLP